MRSLFDALSDFVLLYSLFFVGCFFYAQRLEDNC